MALSDCTYDEYEAFIKNKPVSYSPASDGVVNLIYGNTVIAAYTAAIDWRGAVEANCSYQIDTSTSEDCPAVAKTTLPE